MRFCIILLTFFITGCDNLSFNNKNLINITLVCDLYYLGEEEKEGTQYYLEGQEGWTKVNETPVIHINVDLKKEKGSMNWEDKYTIDLAEINDKELTFSGWGKDIAVLNRRTLNIRAMFKKLECSKVDPI
tara:strand:- start:584 stop:973 length:390 start_codon:yes stop_codon:yes gene_type:complete